MIQVSMIGYATGGAFLGLACFDLYYDLIAIVVILHVTDPGTNGDPGGTDSSGHSSPGERCVCSNPEPDGET